MYGIEMSSVSSRIAKWCEDSIGDWPGNALSAPRWAMARVVSWKAAGPRR
jgi:hypothetical protein